MSVNALSKLKSLIEVRKLVYESNIAKAASDFSRDYNRGKVDFISELECLLNDLED